MRFQPTRSRRIRAPRDDVDNGRPGDQKDQGDRAEAKILITRVVCLRGCTWRCVWIARSLLRPVDFSMTTLWHGASYTDIMASVQVRPINANCRRYS